MIQEILLLVCSILTIISTGMLIVYFIFREDSRTYAFKLVLPIFIFDFIWSFNVFVPLTYYFVNPDSQISKFACNLQGVIKLLATNASFFSSLTITWVLYKFLVKNNPVQTKNPILYFSAFTMLFPTVISLIPMFCDRYGYIQPVKQVMCFLVLKNTNKETDYLGISLRSVLFQAPFFIVLFLDFYFVIRILYIYFQRKDQDLQREVKNLIIYPTILLLSWAWIMTERIIEAINGGNQIKWLNDFDLHGVTLNGFFNALVYGYFSINPFGMCCYKQDTDIMSNSKQDSFIHINSINQINIYNESKIEKSQLVSEISNSVQIKLKDDYDNNELEISQNQTNYNNIEINNKKSLLS